MTTQIVEDIQLNGKMFDGNGALLGPPFGGGGGGSASTPFIQISRVNNTADNFIINCNLYNVYVGSLFVPSVIVACNIANNGINGKDAALTPNSWVYFYAISNGITITTICSNSATAPILPVGYTFFQPIGVFYLKANGRFRTTLQFNTNFTYSPCIYIFTGLTATGINLIDVSNIIPPGCSSLLAWMVTNTSAGTVGDVFTYSENANGSGWYFDIRDTTLFGPTSISIDMPFSMPISGAQYFYTGSIFGTNNNLSCNGYVWEF